MNATAVSSVVKIIGKVKVIIIFVVDILEKKFLSKDISRCPAVMFAINRILKVTGRIKILTVSTNTIKFISELGVPWGVM
jgi:hypothetical protein